MVIVGLNKGRITLKNMITKGSRERSFKPTEVDKIAKFLEPFGVAPHITCSSSCNHPQDYGFKRSFDVFPILRTAIEKVRAKSAVSIKTRKLKEAIKFVEKLSEGAKYPLTVVFEKTDRETGGDVQYGFNDENELTQFVNGMRYARRIAELKGLE